MFGNQPEHDQEWIDAINGDRTLRDRAVKFQRLTGRLPANVAELAQIEFEHRECVQHGDLMALTTPGFNVIWACPKCGSEKLHRHYVSERAAEIECPKHVGVREHFHRGCDECGFHFVEQVLPEVPGQVGAEGWSEQHAPVEE